MQYSLIDPNAKIGKNCHIGAFTVIEGDVIIGDDCHIANNVTICNGARIGNNCTIHQGAVISGVPQDKKYNGEPTLTEIGDSTTIREYCTINRGTIDRYRTTVGANCLLMAYVHVAHDCFVDDNTILANNVTLAGHINIGKHATLGGMVAVHQFVNIGDHVMVGGGSLVRKAIPPYITAAREPLSYAGVNTVGLNRRGFSKADIHHIEDIYRILFVKGHAISKAIALIEQEIPHSEYRDQIINFVKEAKRGLVKGYRGKTK